MLDIAPLPSIHQQPKCQTSTNNTGSYFLGDCNRNLTRLCTERAQPLDHPMVLRFRCYQAPTIMQQITPRLKRHAVTYTPSRTIIYTSLTRLSVTVGSKRSITLHQQRLMVQHQLSTKKSILLSPINQNNTPIKPKHI